MGLVFLEIGHVGKRSRPGDMGAQADVDGDGVKEADELEALHVIEYQAAAAAELGRLGHRVVALACGDYAERHARACAMAREANMPAVYVAGHLNIGADYSAVFYDARSARGANVAESVRSALAAEFAPRRAKAIPASSTGTWANAWSCIAGIWAGPTWLSGITLEPLSLDRDAALIRTGEAATRIGRALAAGLDAFFRRAA